MRQTRSVCWSGTRVVHCTRFPLLVLILWMTVAACRASAALTLMEKSFVSSVLLVFTVCMERKHRVRSTAFPRKNQTVYLIVYVHPDTPAVTENSARRVLPVPSRWTAGRWSVLIAPTTHTRVSPRALGFAMTVRRATCLKLVLSVPRRARARLAGTRARRGTTRTNRRGCGSARTAPTSPASHRPRVCDVGTA